MCKAILHGRVKQFCDGLPSNGTPSTIFSPLAALGNVAGQGDSDETSLPCSQASRVTRCGDVQPTPRARSCRCVSGQPILRCARPCSSQIRNAACGRSRRRVCSERSQDVWILAHDLVSGRAKPRPSWVPRVAAVPSQKKLATCLDTAHIRQTYEQFREQALGTNRLTWNHGLSILPSQGVAAWMQHPAEAYHAACVTRPDSAPQHELVFALAALVIGRATGSEVRHG